MSRTWQIVLGSPANRRDILNIVERCLKEMGITFQKNHATAVGNMLVDASVGRIYMVEVNGEPAGFVSVSFQNSILLASRLSVLEKIYLLERFRATGLWQRVLRAVIGDLEAFGTSVVVADLNEEDALAQIFELEGFSRRHLVRFSDDCRPDEFEQIGPHGDL